MGIYLNTEQKYICVSRPRRFGKSMTLKMLTAYYSCSCDSRDLFAGRKIECSSTFAEHLNKYDVIFLNMQQFLIEAKDQELTDYLEQEVLDELLEEYGEYVKKQGAGLAAALRQIYAKTKKKFIVLIDEWDCVMRERQESEELQKQYLDFLRNLLKDQTYIALAYMTGILPVKKYGQHSALNMFWEYVMVNQYVFEEYTGFTEEEVKELCRRFGMDFDGLRADIVRMLGGDRVRVNTLSFQNDMHNFKTKDDILTLLIHLGYLGYDSERKEAFIPDKEIIMEFENAMSVGEWSEIMRILKASEKLLEDTLNGDEKGVAEGLDRAHMEGASILTYNDENALGSAIGLAYYSARKDYQLIRELPTGYGYAGKILLVGINYSKRTKKHSCKIETLTRSIKAEN